MEDILTLDNQPSFEKHCGLVTFFSENPDEKCDRLLLITPEKRGVTDAKGFDVKTVAIMEKKEHKFYIPTQDKKIQLKLFEYKCLS